MSIKKITDKNGNPIRLVCSTPTQNQVTRGLYELIDSGNIVTINSVVGRVEITATAS